MDKTLKMSLLFDFYGPLLTDRQQNIFDMYFHEDLSLGEISDQLDVSRQAVYDMLKRSGQALTELESKLGLVQRHLELQRHAEALQQELDALTQALQHAKRSDLVARVTKVRNHVEWMLL